MTTHQEADLTSKELNNILPSYLINEVQSSESETQEEQTKKSEEYKLFNIPIFNQEKESKSEKNFMNSENSYKLF